MLLLSIQAWSERLSAVPMSEAGVSLLRLLEEWFAVFASFLLVERIAHEQSAR
jgi:hypothetical protein